MGQLWRLCLMLVMTCVAVTSAVRGAEAAPARQAAGDPAPLTIVMTEYALGPAQVETPTGPVTLQLVNAGIRRHTLTILIDGAEHVSPEVRPGDAADWQITLPRAGRYQLWCNEYRHLEKGMGSELVATGG